MLLTRRVFLWYICNFFSILTETLLINKAQLKIPFHDVRFELRY